MAQALQTGVYYWRYFSATSRGLPCSAEYDPHRTRFPVDQRQKAGEKCEGWKLPSCGRLAAFLLLLLVNKSSLAHHDDATGLCNACKTWLKMLSEFKNTRDSFGGLHAPAHWLPWNSDIKHSSTPQQAGPHAGPGVNLGGEIFNVPITNADESRHGSVDPAGLVKARRGMTQSCKPCKCKRLYLLSGACSMVAVFTNNRVPGAFMTPRPRRESRPKAG